jgi:hypothetical protein
MVRSLLLALAVMPLAAPPVQAQDDPATRVYVAYHQINFGDLEEWIASYQANDVPLLEAMVEEGAITGFGARMHNTGGEYNWRFVVQGNDGTDFDAFWDAYLTRSAERDPAAFERMERMIQAHRDEIWNVDELVLPEDGVPAGEARYFYDAQFQVNFADMEAWNEMWNETFGPALKQAMADGLLDGWVIESHNTGGRFNWKIINIVNDWDDIDDFTEMIFAAAPLSHPIWGMFSAHKDEVWEALPPAGGN